MRSPLHPSRFRWWWPYALISLPLILLIVNCLRGAYCDVQMIRTAALRSEMSRLQSQAVFHVSRLESLIESQAPEGESWTALRNEPWLRGHWSGLQAEDQPQRLYVAITDPAGQIVLHSNPQIEGQRLGPDWYDRRVTEAGPDVFYAPSSPLAGKAPAYE